MVGEEVHFGHVSFDILFFIFIFFSFDILTRHPMLTDSLNSGIRISEERELS